MLPETPSSTVCQIVGGNSIGSNVGSSALGSLAPREEASQLGLLNWRVLALLPDDHIHGAMHSVAFGCYLAAEYRELVASVKSG